MYSLITVNGGHSARSTGASGNGYKEHEVARLIKECLLYELNKVGQVCIDTTSDLGSASEVLKEQVSKCNVRNKNGRLDVSIHLNAGGGTGTEVLYYDQSELATRLSHSISTSLGIRNRGAKQRKDLYFLKNTNAPAILIEVCFIDSGEDMKRLMDNMLLMVKGIVKVLTGKESSETKSPVNNSSMYQVVTGSFKDKENAEKRVAELKSKGFDSFVQIK